VEDTRRAAIQAALQPDIAAEAPKTEAPSTSRLHAQELQLHIARKLEAFKHFPEGSSIHLHFDSTKTKGTNLLTVCVAVTDPDTNKVHSSFIGSAYLKAKAGEDAAGDAAAAADDKSTLHLHYIIVRYS
jgi:hypothetical protein